MESQLFMHEALVQLAAALLLVIPHGEPITDTAVQIERQCFYDEQARFVFCQYIVKEDNHSTGRIDIRAWVMRKDYELFIHSGTMIYHDGRTLRRLRYQTYVETHSQIDHELAARSLWPQEWRRKLTEVGRNK